jgi:hypothetical protein
MKLFEEAIVSYQMIHSEDGPQNSLTIMYMVF